MEETSQLDMLCLKHVILCSAIRDLLNVSLERERQETNDGQQIYKGAYQAHGFWSKRR